jgi:predicted RNA binding protein YcfA (HicA-like mRNA interferase family)
LGKLRVLSGREVCEILEAHGFTAVRQRGGTITVPVPNHGELKLGTLSSIVRQSGLARSIFETQDRGWIARQSALAAKLPAPQPCMGFLHRRSAGTSPVIGPQ